MFRRLSLPVRNRKQHKKLACIHDQPTAIGADWIITKRTDHHKSRPLTTTPRTRDLEKHVRLRTRRLKQPPMAHQNANGVCRKEGRRWGAISTARSGESSRYGDAGTKQLKIDTIPSHNNSADRNYKVIHRGSIVVHAQPNRNRQESFADPTLHAYQLPERFELPGDDTIVRLLSAENLTVASVTRVQSLLRWVPSACMLCCLRRWTWASSPPSCVP